MKIHYSTAEKSMCEYGHIGDTVFPQRRIYRLLKNEALDFCRYWDLDIEKCIVRAGYYLIIM